MRCLYHSRLPVNIARGRSGLRPGLRGREEQNCESRA